MESGDSSIHFLNVEYFFRLIYDALTNAHATTFSWAGIIAFVSHLWIALAALSILLAAGFIASLVYSTTRLHQLLALQLAKAGPLDAKHAEVETEHHRWKHVMSLIESPHENDWRQAIIEADIILDDLLVQLGFVGEGVAEKLKRVNADHFHTLQEAWEAHKVRNEIAHQGSAFQLTDHLAYRTIKQYENVFREHNEI